MNAAELIALIQLLGISQFVTDTSTAERSFESLGATAQSAMQMLETAMSSATEAFVDFTRAAIDEAAKVETLRLSFTGLMGSADGAGQMLQQLRQYALLGIGEFDNLTSAALRLYTAGLNPLRLIKMTDVMGKFVAPENPKQGTFEVADALARAASGGNLGKAMMVFRRVGIGMGDLIAEGLNVSAGNHITEKYAGQFIEAIEHIFKKKKLDVVGTMLEDSMSVKFSNVADAWNYMLERFGSAWFPFISRVLDSIVPFMKFLSNSGEMEKLGQIFSEAFSHLFGMAGGEGGVVKFLSYVIATLEKLPDIIQTVGSVLINVAKASFGFVDKYFVNLVNAAMEGVVPIYNLFKNAGAIWLNIIQPGIEHRTPDVVAPRFKGVGDMLSQALDVAGGGALNHVGGDINKRATDLMLSFLAHQDDATPFADHSKDPLFNALHTQTDDLGAIRDNTQRIAAAMEPFKAFALGGGDRGRVGVTVAQMYGRGGSGTVRLETGRATSLMQSAVNEMIGEGHQAMRRALGGP